MRYRNYFGFFAYPLAAIIRAIESFFRTLYVDGKTMLAIDGLRRAVRDAPGALSRVRAFMARALKHDCYTAGYFDPGRSFA
jgi:hypothetical protein